MTGQRLVCGGQAGRRPESYARDLYNNLRTLDRAGCQRILVQGVPDGEGWDAIRDRLLRAASSVAESDDGTLASTGSMSNAADASSPCVPVTVNECVDVRPVAASGRTSRPENILS